jgi:hypothetical protein
VSGAIARPIGGHHAAVGLHNQDLAVMAGELQFELIQVTRDHRHQVGVERGG